MTKAEIRREVERVSSEYTACDLFASPYFQEMLQSTITSVCEKLGRLPRIRIICDATNDMTASTDGMTITQNTQGPLIRELEGNWKQYVANIGHVVHECGHVLFTDFHYLVPMQKGWCTGRELTFHPAKPKMKDADTVRELLSANSFMRVVYTSAMRGIVNTLEDAYVENRLREHFSGLAVAGIALINDEMYRKFDTLSAFLGKIQEGRAHPIHLAGEILLSRYVCYQEMKPGEPLSDEQQEILSIVSQVLDRCRPTTDALAHEQDGRRRAELFNQLFVELFPLMVIFRFQQAPDNGPDEAADGKQGGNGNKDGQPSLQSGERSGANTSAQGDEPSGGASAGTQDTGGMEDLPEDLARQLTEHAEKEARRIGTSEAPEGNTSGIRQEEQGENTDKRRQAQELATSQESMQRELQQALREAARREVLDRDEKNHEKELRMEARRIEKDMRRLFGMCRFKGYETCRTNPDKAFYEEIYREVASASKNLSRKIRNILKERETESVESGFLMGQRFDSRTVANKDGKYFSRQIVPDGKADVCFGVLVDCSGSMCSDSKDEKARRAAILLEDALRTLDIPLMITGHTESYGECTLYLYKDFDTNDGKDCYRLANIRAESGNIDGAAIAYVGEKLLKRSEKSKVMIVISDGLPAGTSFFASDDNTDTKLAVEYYRKKGLRVFGAIVDEVEEVTRIYGQEYSFDCTSNQALEKELMKLIKKYVLLQG